MSSRSRIVKLSLFIFELKFCGVVPIRRANPATLIFERTHNTFICSEIVMRVLLDKINNYFDNIKILFYAINTVHLQINYTIRNSNLQLKPQIVNGLNTSRNVL